MPLRIIMGASLLWHLHGNTFGSDGITALVTLQLTVSEVMSAFGPDVILRADHFPSLCPQRGH